MGGAKQGSVPPLVTAYTSGLNRGRWAVVALWIVLGGVFGYFAGGMLGRTSQAFVPPDGSQAQEARAALGRLWPEKATASNLVLFVGPRHDVNASALQPVIPSREMNDFTDALKGYIQKKYPDILTATGFVGYYTIPDSLRHLPLVQSFVGAGNMSTIVAIEVKPDFLSAAAQDFAVDFAAFADGPAFAALSGMGYRNVLSGVPAFLDTMVSSSEQDLLSMDVIVLPLSMFVLAYIVQSLRLMLLPIASIGLTLGVSFGIMYFVAGVMSVNTVAPSLMMSVIIAMTIDYNLFILTRYTEELRLGNRGAEGMAIVVNSAGRTILVSGLTLCCCFLGLLAFRMDMLSSLGVGCAISIVIAIIVNLAFVPACLLCFPNFFERSAAPLVLPEWWVNNRVLSKLLSGTRGAEAEEAQPLVAPAGGGACVVDEEQLREDTPVYYKLGKLMQRFPAPLVVVGVIACLLIPFGLKAFGFKVKDSMEDYMPRGSPMRSGFIDMVDGFGYGVVYPFEVIIEPPPGTNFAGQEFYDTTQQFFEAYAACPTLKATAPHNFQFFSYPGTAALSYAKFKECLTMPSSDLCLEAMTMFATALNPASTAAMGNIVLDIDPIGTDGREWYMNSVDFLNKWNADHPGWHVYITGMAGDSMEMINSVYDMFPTMVSVTGAVVLVLVGLAFRSALVPLRAVISIGATLVFVFGFTVMTYQYGALDWMGWASVGSTGALSWTCPVVSFAIIIGVALDYDVFLLSRIAEYADQGYTTQDAILLGLCRTGGIITAAGVIMAIAFSGLLFSHTMVMNQLSVFMVFSVLFDTFVMRTLLVPALMILFGKYNWWPMLKYGDTRAAGTPEPDTKDGDEY